MKKKMNYSYKEHEFWLFFCTKWQKLSYSFLENITMFLQKLPWDIKKHVFYLFSALSITVFGSWNRIGKGRVFWSLFSFAFQICLKKRDIFLALIFCIVKGIKKSPDRWSDDWFRSLSSSGLLFFIYLM